MLKFCFLVGFVIISQSVINVSDDNLAHQCCGENAYCNLREPIPAGHLCACINGDIKIDGVTCNRN